MVIDTPTVPGWMQPGAFALLVHSSGAISGGTRDPLQYICEKLGFTLAPG